LFLIFGILLIPQVHELCFMIMADAIEKCLYDNIMYKGFCRFETVPAGGSCLCGRLLAGHRGITSIPALSKAPGPERFAGEAKRVDNRPLLL
jgi:hypothetical protein